MNAPAVTEQSRQVRVFVSSTFRDMHAERDHLVKFIFPQLRQLCESRGVVWSEVDLRWGVTDEEAAEGRVLPICLQEIDRCRPYFIGLLGERYGWVPPSISADLLEQEPWLQEQFAGRKSVTELEILHAVLRDPAMAGHAYFYFRDPAYVKSRPDNERSDFITSEPTELEKLHQLKQRIRDRRLPVRENYATPEQLGALVLADFTAVIERLFPAGSAPDPLTREALDHAAYARSRQRAYIHHPGYLDRLDAHAASHDPQPLVVLGASGSGKSALLSNWAAAYRNAHPTACVIEHYIGATPASSDWAAMLRRIMGEFNRQLGLTLKIPDPPDDLREAFRTSLHQAAARHPIVLILDALNQLDDRDGAPDLTWLPPVLPERVRLIVSTLPGRALDATAKRQWPTWEVQPLDLNQRKELIRVFLRDYSRSLGPKLVDRIVQAPQSANPLYLRVLLNELRLFGRDKELLEQQIVSYLEAGSPYELFGQVIARWSADYGRGTTLVSDALSLLWAARHGLSEAEILAALGTDGQPLPHARWSPLFLAMADALVNRGGLLTFAHDYLRQAVRDKYLPDQTSRRTRHLALAAYFAGRPIASSRTAAEWPWQLAAAEAWPALARLLGSWPAFQAIEENDRFDLKTYWARLEENGLTVADTYRAVLDDPENHPVGQLLTLAKLVRDQGHLDPAQVLVSAATLRCRSENNQADLADAIMVTAGIVATSGEPAKSLELYRAAREICRETKNAPGMLSALANEALVHKALGQFDQALELQRAVERLSREIGDRDGVMRALGNQASLLYLRGQLADALTLCDEEERLCQELGDQAALQACLGNQAIILMAQDDLDLADTRLVQQARICRELGIRGPLVTCLGNRAALLIQRENYAAASEVLAEQERLCVEIGDQAALSRALGNQGMVAGKRGDHNRALALHRRSAAMDRAAGNLASLAIALYNQGDDYWQIGDLDMAMSRYRECEALSRQLNSAKGIALSLLRQAGLIMTAGSSRDQARQMVEAAHELATNAGLRELNTAISAARGWFDRDVTRGERS